MGEEMREYKNKVSLIKGIHGGKMRPYKREDEGGESKRERTRRRRGCRRRRVGVRGTTGAGGREAISGRGP